MTNNTPELLHPRPIDLPAVLPLDGPIDAETADLAKIFAAPDDPADWPRWRERLDEWLDGARSRWPYDDSAYTRPSARWAGTCFSVALLWLWDERLFDHQAERFTVDAFLDQTADFGGFDAVVLWQAYPIIGIDERTQFDYYRVPGIADVVQSFHHRGIKVFVDYNPWDTAAGDLADHPRRVADLVTDLGVDGVFLDTMSEGGAELRAALHALPNRPVLEGESRVTLARLVDHELSWAQWFGDSDAPGVMRARWFERRHMLHHTRRWNRDHSDELQSSWMNGTGMLVWDNVFGSWVGWNRRDRSTLRAMTRAQRVLADVLTAGVWTPLTDATAAAVGAGVYASRYEHGAITLWTIVNRRDTDYTGPVLEPRASLPESATWLDVTRGRRLDSGTAAVTVPARGVAGVLAVDGPVPDAIAALVAAAAADRHDTDSTFPARLPVRRPVPPTSAGTAPADVVELAPGRRELTITYRLRETGMYTEAPFVEAWKPLPPLLHSDVAETFDVELGRVVVATREVTSAEFAEFVDATGQRTAATLAGEPAADEPMTHVNLTDARAYAAWRHARLPTEFEWQVAADDDRFERRHPLVWNLTESEHTDGITRFVILKGGSAYAPTESDWYFDGGPRPPSFSAKLLLAGLGVERSDRIGFRLAWDLDRMQR